MGRRETHILDDLGVITRGSFSRIAMRRISSLVLGGKARFLLFPWHFLDWLLLAEIKEKGKDVHTNNLIAWSSSQSTANILLGEYANTNAAGTRVSWATVLTSAETIASILPAYLSWVDSSYLGVSAL